MAISCQVCGAVMIDGKYQGVGTCYDCQSPAQREISDEQEREESATDPE